MEKYTCVLEGRNSRLSITYNFSPKIIFRQLWKACQKLWKVLTIFILCFKLDSTKISHFNNDKCKSTREKSDEKVMTNFSSQRDYKGTANFSFFRKRSGNKVEEKNGIKMDTIWMQFFEFFHEHKDSKRHRTKSEQRE